MPDPTGYVIDAVALEALDGTSIEALARIEQRFMAERSPTDPAYPVSSIARRWQTTRPSEWRAAFRASDRSGTAVGFAAISADASDLGNTHVRWSEIAVDAAHRRHGIGRALL